MLWLRSFRPASLRVREFTLGKQVEAMEWDNLDWSSMDLKRIFDITFVNGTSPRVLGWAKAARLAQRSVVEVEKERRAEQERSRASQGRTSLRAALQTLAGPFGAFSSRGPPVVSHGSV